METINYHFLPRPRWGRPRARIKPIDLRISQIGYTAVINNYRAETIKLSCRSDFSTRGKNYVTHCDEYRFIRVSLVFDLKPVLGSIRIDDKDHRRDRIFVEDRMRNQKDRVVRATFGFGAFCSYMRYVVTSALIGNKCNCTNERSGIARAERGAERGAVTRGWDTRGRGSNPTSGMKTKGRVDRRSRRISAICRAIAGRRDGSERKRERRWRPRQKCTTRSSRHDPRQGEYISESDGLKAARSPPFADLSRV